MRMPGFTAEVSLYRTSERYRMLTAGTLADGRDVVPQWCYSPRPGQFCCCYPYLGCYCRTIHPVFE